MKHILLMIFSLMLIGCEQTKFSDLKEEKAEVIQLSYIPSTTSSVSGLSMDMTGSGGIGIVYGSSTTSEVWVVVFRCDHKKTFAFKGKEIYDRCKVGEIVTLKYVEEIRFDPKKFNSEKVVDYHTKQIIFGDLSKVERGKK